MTDLLTIPVAGPSVWRGDELDPSNVVHELTSGELAELHRAVDWIGGRDVTTLSPADLPLPAIDELIEGCAEILDDGLGFTVLRGIEVGETFSREQAADAFWVICARLGRLVPTEQDGTFLNHVYDRGATPDPNRRAYTTNIGGFLHTDGVEIVGLMCLQPSPTGGESIVASSMTMYNMVLDQHREWLPILFKNFACDWKSEAPPGSVGWFPQSLYCHVDGWLSATLKTGYHRSAARFEGVPKLTDEELACMDYLDDIPQRPGMTHQMRLEPGDIQLVNNYVTLHSRQPYEDDPDRPDLRRHMLRHWISRSGLSTRVVSPEYEFGREDFFGLTRPVPEMTSTTT
jgi:hypothetical protein